MCHHTGQRFGGRAQLLEFVSLNQILGRIFIIGIYPHSARTAGSSTTFAGSGGLAKGTAAPATLAKNSNFSSRAGGTKRLALLAANQTFGRRQPPYRLL